MSIDVDEKIEGMCDKCRKETEKKACTRCGDKLEEREVLEVSKNFDEEKFKTLARK